MACILLLSSAVRVHDSQAYRQMDVKRERISCILELREISLSFQTGFNHVNAAVVCAILESISTINHQPTYTMYITKKSVTQALGDASGLGHSERLCMVSY